MVKIRGGARVATVRIEDRHSVTEFEGTLTAEVSTRVRDGKSSSRWVEIRLYRMDDGWLLHRIGKSLVYHSEDSECKTATRRPSGDVATRADLPRNAVSCDRCRPPWPEDLEDGEKIRYEFARHTIDRCDDPAQVVRRLTSMRQRRSGMRSTMVSEPVAELLAQAAGNDPDFAHAPKPVERIT